MRTPIAAAATLTCMAVLAAQEGVPRPQGLVPEQMWPAPGESDWKKPVVIQWQRTWDDAVRLSQATKRAILVCVNMDGEIASEHYAGIRYRDPEIGKLYEPYVCVIASVYRHNPRDYDDQGRRIPCPRFGCVTCGEHIALEPLVYEKFLKGKRIAPRHIMVELDGSESYDIYYRWDTASVFKDIADGITNRKVQTVPLVKGDRSLLERLESPDSADRQQVESEFAKATPEQRRAMVAAAIGAGELAPVEILRLAAWGLDPALAQEARKGMVVAKDPGTVNLIAETLRAPLEHEERKELVAALGRFGSTSTYAQALATAHQGLDGTTTSIDTGKWSRALAAQTYAPPASEDLTTALEQSDKALAAEPSDPAARLDAAEASLLQALDTTSSGGRGSARRTAAARQSLLSDAERQANLAIAQGATGWRPTALRAIAAFHLGRVPEAHQLAVAAAPDLPPDAPGRVAMEVLALFAVARQHAIVAAVRNKQTWPPQWAADVHAAYAVLAHHPLGRDEHAADHYDFLKFFSSPETDAVLDRALERFPESALLHQRLRDRILERRDPDALEAEYARRLNAPEARPSLSWFAGYASLVAAEQNRRNQRRENALAAYRRGIEHFETYAKRSGNEDGNHYVAMANAGIARLQLDAGDLPGALASLQLAFRTAPLAAAAVDGLGVTAVQTADMLRARAVETNAQDVVQAVDQALTALPDEALIPPEYERASGNTKIRRRR
ncbi:MAG: hypothetical protein JNK78_10140 [Planctomycetes bacterium]|nr:hypothetical protein [Planctomycetota bacterium]